MDIGHWTLEIGDWILEIGDWRLENGEWKLETGEWRLENGEWRLKSFSTYILINNLYKHPVNVCLVKEYLLMYCGEE